MLFYFDFQKYLTMLRLMAKTQGVKAKWRFVIPLLLVPLFSLLHAIFFFLDGLLFPGLHFTRVKKPVFIVGHGRSGTTLMHRLMTNDGDQFSAFRFYEMLLPSLTEKKIIRGIACLDRVLLKERMAKRIKAWEEENLFTETQDIHKTTLTSYEEDEQILLFSMAAGFWMALIPFINELDFHYIDEMQDRKRRRLMKFYKACVKRQLYLNGGDKIHLSKNPNFCGRVESLIETFPDARFVVMMRNPFETIPSLLKLLRESWTAMGWDKATMEDSLAAVAELSFHTYRYPQEVLARHPEVPSLVVDYRELVDQPKRTVEHIYETLQLPMREEYQQELVAQEQRAKAHETTHSYSLTQFGLDKDLIADRLADMFEVYQWPKQG